MSQSTQYSTAACELCRQTIGYPKPGDLKGICSRCCSHLGGGKYSGQIVKTERAAIVARKEVR